MIAGADPYFPGHGDLTYDVTKYDLTLDYKVSTNHLVGRATIHGVALADLDSFELNLSGLVVGKVTVDGVRSRRHKRQGNRLAVWPHRQIARGTSFVVVVDYQGHPSPVHGPHGECGWEELDDGSIVAAQPYGASSWFPCNDRPSSKAAYTITVAADAAYHVVANGTLSDVRRGASRTTWVYYQPEPMATYLAAVHIGRYEPTVLIGSAPISVYRPRAMATKADAALARQPDMMAAFVELFGPYPFRRYAVVVTPDALEIPLEAQGMATFGANHMTASWEAQRLIAHELAHQWFGNSLTLGHWRDIWLHEGFACYSEWMWSERSGGPTAHAHAERHWARLARLPQDLVLTAPAPPLLFDDRIYKRGALLLHRVRTLMDDERFFLMLRDWTASNAHGTVTTGMWVDQVRAHAGNQVVRTMDSWLFEAPLPALG
jgi:aminopeptidase N